MLHLHALAVLLTAGSLTAGSLTAMTDTVPLGDSTWHRSEWRASSFSTSAQDEATVAVLGDGTIVTAWSSRRQQEGTYGVYAQRFDADGVAVGTETLLNLWTTSHQQAPALAADADGVWAVWQSHGQDGDAGAIIARRLEAQLVTGAEVLVNETAIGHQADPVVVAAPDGRALVLWRSLAPGDGHARAFARLLDEGGAPIGGEFAVARDDNRPEAVPAAAFLDDGGFVIAVALADCAHAPEGIAVQRFDRNAQPIGARWRADAGMPRPGIEPAVAAVPGGLALAWLEPDARNEDYRIVARRFDANGAAQSPLHEVGAGLAHRSAPALAGDGDGRVVACFNAAGADGEPDIHVQVLGEETAARLTRSIEGPQRLRIASAAQRLAVTPRGDLVCAWSGDAGLGDGSSANVTMLSRAPRELGSGTVRGITDAMPPADALALADGPTPHVPPAFDPDHVATGRRELPLGPGGGFTGILNTGWTPPDPTLAVGPEHIVAMTNGAIAFFTKDGDLTFQDEIEDSFGFWGEVGATNFVFDPEALYDPMSGRFFVMAAEDAGSTSYFLLAISDDDDPNGTWFKHRISTTAQAGGLFDSPNMGVDANAVYITGDGFGGSVEYPIYVMDKASLIAGDPPAIFNVTELVTNTQSAGIPPVSFDAPPALYMAEHRELNTSTSVRLHALTDPLGTPDITTITLPVPAYTKPEDPPQQGTSLRPETFDARFWSVAYRDGSLWATHHVGNSRVLARWYEFAMNGWPTSGQQPELVQSGEIDPGPGIRTFFSAITADAHGNALITFARSSFNEFISMGTAARLAGDPEGEFGEPVIEKTSTSPYTFANRWGDYAGADVDPVEPFTFWAHHEYATGNSWSTWIVPVQVDGGNPADLNGDGVVDGADLGLLLGDWGPCEGCPADLNGDGVVDGADLGLLLGAWTVPA